MAQGTVQGVEDDKYGNLLINIGGTKYKVYPKKYQSEDPNPVFEAAGGFGFGDVVNFEATPKGTLKSISGVSKAGAAATAPQRGAPSSDGRNASIEAQVVFKAAMEYARDLKCTAAEAAKFAVDCWASVVRYKTESDDRSGEAPQSE